MATYVPLILKWDLPTITALSSSQILSGNSSLLKAQRMVCRHMAFQVHTSVMLQECYIHGNPCYPIPP